jgi:hypothetical protein
MNNLFRLLKQKLILQKNTSWPIGNQTKEFIFKQVNENTRSIETGIGYSTFIFGAKKASHTVIFPDQSVESKVRDYANKNDINLDRVNFIVGKSEDVLPTLTQKINFALIDGEHKFPNAMIDFFYLNNLLEVNGMMLIDDLKINSVRVLYEFLIVSSKWKLIGIFDNNRCCCFQKIKNDEKDWHRTQEFNTINYYDKIKLIKI